MEYNNKISISIFKGILESASEIARKFVTLFAEKKNHEMVYFESVDGVSEDNSMILFSLSIHYDHSHQTDHRQHSFPVELLFKAKGEETEKALKEFFETLKF
jgi:hypothetical protein